MDLLSASEAGPPAEPSLYRDRRDRPARLWAAASRAASAARHGAAGLLVVLATLFALPLQAQTAYVSNTGQIGTIGFSVDTTAHQGQKFTTGSQSGGYTLGSVGLKFTSDKSSTTGLIVRIYSTDAGGNPDAVVYTLTNPSSATAFTEVLFTAPVNAMLSADTSYFVVGESTTSISHILNSTTNTAQNSGGSAGWSIADKRHFRAGDSDNWRESTSSGLLNISIYPPGTTSADPVFTDTAPVTRSFNETEGDTTVQLSGVSNIGAPVAAMDGNTTRTYTMTVTREDVPVVTIEADQTSVLFWDTDDADSDGVSDGTASFTLTRTGSTNEALTATVNLTQDRPFLRSGNNSVRPATFIVGSSTAVLTIPESDFQDFPVGEVFDNGTLTATVAPGTGYDAGMPVSASVSIVIALTVGLDMDEYTIVEGEELQVKLVVRTGEGAPKPTEKMYYAVSTRLLLPPEAESQDDYIHISLNPGIPVANYEADGTVYRAEVMIDIQTVNDAQVEGDEALELVLEYLPGPDSHIKYANFVNADGESCHGACVSRITIIDDDTAGVTVSEMALTVTEEDTTGDSYTVVLDTEPTANVMVTVAAPAGTDVTPDPANLIFTSVNWGTPQEVRVTAANDADIVNDTVTLTHSAESSDGNYSGITIASVTVTVIDTDNTPATGAPVISGAAQVGEVLTADTGGIADADGLTSPGYTYQWIRVDEFGTETNIGADAGAYTLVAADAGGKIRVQASFTDDADNPEALTSDAWPAGAATINTAPVFAGVAPRILTLTETVGDATVAVALDIGAPVAATDADGDTLEYTLGGPDMAKFGIVPTSGQIQTLVGESYDYEAKTSYSVTVTADDRNGGTALIAVTINVNDLEPPLAPDAPVVVTIMDFPDSLIVEWTQPDNTDRPAITGYDLRYRKTTENAWIAGPGDESGLMAFILNLVEDTEYEVQVRATNGEGDSPWSQSGTGTTDALPALSFNSANVEVAENEGVGMVGVELDRTSLDTITVDYQTQDSTAVAGVDYTATTGTLTFAPGVTSQAITIPILDNDTFEAGAPGSFRVMLGNPAGATLPASAVATVSIRDDEGVPMASIVDVTAGEGGTMRLTLTLDHPSSLDTAYGATAGDIGGTATRGVDYEDDFLTGGSVSFTVPAGDLSATLAITITDDMVAEDDETITIRWTLDQSSNRGEATPVSLDFTGVITDDDAAGVTVSETALTVTEEDTTGDSYTVVLDSRPTADVMVTVAAPAGTDVTPKPATLTFTSLDWDTPRTVTVTAGDDGDTDNETVTLTHSATSSDGDYSSIAIPGVTVTVLDNDTAQVTGVMVTEGNGQLVVEWTAVSNATGYRVQWKSDGEDYNTGDRQATVTPGSTISHTIGGLANGAEYMVRVIATRSGANDGPPSAEVMGMPEEPGVTVSGSPLTVTEEDTTGDSYTVVLDTEPTADVTVTVAGHAGTDVTPTPTPLIFTSTTWSTPQEVRVTAGDDGDTDNETVTLTHSATSSDGDYSSIAIPGVTVTVLDNDTAQVTGVMVTEGNGQLVVEWTAVSNATGYRVQWKSDGEDYNTGDRQATVTSGSTISHTIGGLANGAEYMVRVIATRSGANDGPPSAEVMGMPLSDDATLRALALADASDDNPIALNEMFMPNVTEGYTADVANGVEQITIDPKVNEPNATVAYEDGSNTMIDDENLINTGLQVTLVDGDNVIVVKVMAHDGTTQDYTLTVTRNTMPVFAGGAPATRNLAERMGDAPVTAVEAIGDPVMATDTDGDPLTYALEGTDADRFTFDTSTGQISTRMGENYDHEVTPICIVTVTARDSNGGTAVMAVTINVNDRNEPPLAPDAPTMSPTTDSTTSLDVSWDAPDNMGRPAIMSYDLRYKKTPDSTWTDGPQNVSGMSASISGLEPDTAYEVQVRATNDEGVGPWSAFGTGSTAAIPDRTAPVASWLPRFGRTVSEQVVETAQARMAATPVAGLAGQLAGQTIAIAPGRGSAEARADAEADFAALGESFFGAGDATGNAWDDTGDGRDGAAERGYSSRALTGRDFLTGSAFALTGDGGDSAATLWGRGAVTSFDGRDGSLSVDGEVVSGMLGIDWRNGERSGGLMLSRSRGEGDYRSSAAGGAASDDGRISATLTGLYPWLGHRVNDRLTLWGVAGYGRGTLTLTPAGEDALSAGIGLTMGSVGARGALGAGAEGVVLAWEADALALRTTSDAASGAEGRLDATSSGVTRVRLGLTGSRRFRLGSGAALTPGLEVGLRHDGGDAETGFGTDIGVSLDFADPARGITAAVSARGLLDHAAQGFRERGLSATLTWDQRPGSDLGWSLSLDHGVGAATEGGAASLLARQSLAGLLTGDGDDGADTTEGNLQRRFDATLGYGVPMAAGRFVAVSGIGFGLTDAGREYSVGWRLGLARSGPMDLHLGLEATRQESTTGSPTHDLGLDLGAAIRW